MANSHYIADSSPTSFHLPLLRRSDVTGSSRHAFVPDCGITTAGNSFPATASSIG
jgi:hypothetical protein